MASKAERVSLENLLDEIETLRCWLDDTGYPRTSRESLEIAIKEAQRQFRIFPVMPERKAD